MSKRLEKNISTFLFCLLGHVNISWINFKIVSHCTLVFSALLFFFIFNYYTLVSHFLVLLQLYNLECRVLLVFFLCMVWRFAFQTLLWLKNKNPTVCTKFINRCVSFFFFSCTCKKHSQYWINNYLEKGRENITEWVICLRKAKEGISQNVLIDQNKSEEDITFVQMLPAVFDKILKFPIIILSTFSMYHFWMKLCILS